jgi:hypothetical protein
MSSWTPGQLVALETAIASGAKTISYEGKQITYASLDEMLRIRNIIQVALGLIARPSSTVLVAHSRGYPGFGTVSSDAVPFGYEDEGTVIG